MAAAGSDLGPKGEADAIARVVRLLRIVAQLVQRDEHHRAPPGKSVPRGVGGVRALAATVRNQGHEEGVARNLLASRRAIVGDRPCPAATVDRGDEAVPILHVVDQLLGERARIASGIAGRVAPAGAPVDTEGRIGAAPLFGAAPPVPAARTARSASTHAHPRASTLERTRAAAAAPGLRAIFAAGLGDGSRRPRSRRWSRPA